MGQFRKEDYRYELLEWEADLSDNFGDSWQHKDYSGDGVWSGDKFKENL